jgi:hypothetical protein
MDAFISDTTASQPMNSDKYSLDHNFNGFGWDTDRGMFIPVDEELEYFQSPFAKIQVVEISDE